jgi:hypothetical protein
VRIGYWECSGELSGDIGGDMPGRSEQRKCGTTRGSLRRSRTEWASRINRCTAKSRCACEWGGWGRISEDGSGHYNPNWSEGPWGRAKNGAQTVVLDRTESCGFERRNSVATESTKGGCTLIHPKGMPGAGLSGGGIGKAPSEKPALEPYWGKPAVRNLRGGSRRHRAVRVPNAGT